MLKPDRHFDRITSIDIKEDLLNQGLTCVLIDIDNTVRPRDTRVVPDDVRAWLSAAQAAGVTVCLLSNNIHKNVYEFAAELDVPVIGKAMKPLPFGYMVALRRMGKKVRETCMIGDQLFTDCWGGSLVGMANCFVDPLCDVEVTSGRIMRPIERKVLQLVEKDRPVVSRAFDASAAPAEPAASAAPVECAAPAVAAEGEDTAMDNAASQKLFILGHPIAHSKSPAMYNALYPELGLSWNYLFADLSTEEEAQAFLDARDFLSINITTPYKPTAFAAADVRDASAVLAHGSNLLVREAREGVEQLVAYNVDGEGCVTYLQLAGVNFDDAQVVVCGTGPTSLAIFHACIQAGARVTLCGRDHDRTNASLARYLEERDATGLPSAAGVTAAASYETDRDAIAAADVIIDATPLGMNEGDPAPFDTALLHAGQVVFDCVYGHGLTTLRADAAAAGCVSLDGAGMLVAQAVASARKVLAAAGQPPLDERRAFNLMAAGAGFDLEI